MWWVLIWILMLLTAGGYLGSRLWGLWGQTKELGSELALAERRLSEVQGQLEVLGEKTGPSAELAVFAEPAAVRKERIRARAAGRQSRKQRRAGPRPAWVKHVD